MRERSWGTSFGVVVGLSRLGAFIEPMLSGKLHVFVEILVEQPTQESRIDVGPFFAALFADVACDLESWLAASFDEVFQKRAAVEHVAQVESRHIGVRSS